MKEDEMSITLIKANTADGERSYFTQADHLAACAEQKTHYITHHPHTKSYSLHCKLAGYAKSTAQIGEVATFEDALDWLLEQTKSMSQTTLDRIVQTKVDQVAVANSRFTPDEWKEFRSNAEH